MDKHCGGRADNSSEMAVHRLEQKSQAVETLCGQQKCRGTAWHTTERLWMCLERNVDALEWQ